jgi:hypothetical protein
MSRNRSAFDEAAEATTLEFPGDRAVGNGTVVLAYHPTANRGA